MAEVRALQPGAGRGRRGALHLRLGARLPAGLPGAGSPDPGHRPATGGRADRHRLAAGPRRHHRAARPERPEGRGLRAGPAQPLPRGGALPDRGLPVAAADRAAARGQAARASSTCRPGGPPRSWPSSSPRPASRPQFYHGGMPAGARARTARGVPRRPGADHGRHLGVRHGHRQAEHRAGWCTWRCPTRRTATCRRSAGPAATAHAARVLLLWQAEDVGLQRFFSGGRAGRDRAARPGRAGAQAGRPPRPRCKETSGLGAAQARPVAGPAGAGRRGRAARQPPARRAPVRARRRPTAAKAALAEAERQQAVTRSRTDMMRAFAETQQLPRADAAGLLRRADDRRSAGTATTATPAPAPPPTARAARSRCTARCGTPSGAPGLVLSYEEDKMTVLFDEVGTRPCPCRWSASRACSPLDPA